MTKHFNRVISIFFVAAFLVRISITCSSKADTSKNTKKEVTKDIGLCRWRVPPLLASQYENGRLIDMDSNQQHWDDKSDLVTKIVCCDLFYYNDVTHHCESKQCPNGNECQQNAYCTDHNVCECKLGYEKSYYGECRPKCRDDCPYGKCVEPNVCLCNNRYENPRFDRGSCVPVCTEYDCHRDQCIGSDFCKSKCEGGCQDNASCIAPNTCKCNPGFEEDGPTKICIPESKYKNRQW